MHKKNKWLRVAVTTRSRIHRLTIKENTMNASDDISERTLRATQKILIVEDNRMNQIVAIQMLERFGYPYDIADHAAAALEKLSTNEYAAIILDIGLPDINGLDLIPLIRMNHNTPIITWTAYGDESERDCLAAGAVAHLPKPITNMGKFESMLVKTIEGNNVNIHPPRK
jgi:CheY-like chemotaxis protein